MPLPALGLYGLIAIVTLAGAGAYSIYQVRVTVKDVTEVFTNQESFFNSGITQIAIGAITLFVVMKYAK